MSHGGELIFIGLGLHSERSLSIEGLEAARSADVVFLETYTSIMPGLDVKRLEQLLGKRVKILSRRELEDEMRKLIELARQRRVALLVPGDPFIATTHIALRVEAEKHGVRTRVVNGVSILTAIPGLTGLQAYKFGRTVTLTYPEETYRPETVYDVTKRNLEAGLHTVILLDLRAEEGRAMTIPEAVEILRDLERRRGEGIFTDDRLVVGIARAGAPDVIVKADALARLGEHPFGPPPHTMVVPARLHFMEAEALEVLAGAPPELVRELVSR